MLYCFSQNGSNYHVNSRRQSSSVNVWNVRAQHLNVLISTLFCTPTFTKCRISKTLLLRPINSNLKRMLKSWFYPFYPSRNPSEPAPAPAPPLSLGCVYRRVFIPERLEERQHALLHAGRGHFGRCVSLVP